jgi:hypothetical protein
VNYASVSGTSEYWIPRTPSYAQILNIVEETQGLGNIAFIGRSDSQVVESKEEILQV